MEINKKDVLWSYGATFLKIASSVLLLPFILRIMPSEMVGIWTIFMTVTSFSNLLDFGFNPSFSRNVTYIFSGVRSLKVNGFESITSEKQKIDYGLLKGVIIAMRWFYFRMAIVLFFILITIGTYYIYTLLFNYNGNHVEVYIAWLLLCIINTYNLFTLYYDSLLQGKGMIMRSKQIIVIGQIVYLIIATILIIIGLGLIAIVSSQVISVIIIRWLSYRSFFTDEIKSHLNSTKHRNKDEVLRAIYPNAIKIGLTSLGGFMIQKSSILIGSLYLSLKDIASYGITIQIISVISIFSAIYITTYQPKITNLRVSHKTEEIKKIYIKGQKILFLNYLIFGTMLLIFGQWGMKLIGSKTTLLPAILLNLLILVSLIETNLSIAGNILLSKNIVPFFKASLISGGVIIFGLLLLFNYTDWGIVIMIIVPLLVDVSYQAWKWPLEVIKDLSITFIKQSK